jgi:hypothetical protein
MKNFVTLFEEDEMTEKDAWRYEKFKQNFT